MHGAEIDMVENAEPASGNLRGSTSKEPKLRSQTEQKKTRAKRSEAKEGNPNEVRLVKVPELRLTQRPAGGKDR